MAYNPRKIEPVDLEGRKIIGVKLPFGGDHSDLYERGNVLDREQNRHRRPRSRTTIFVPTYQTKDAIRTNLLNYFMTARGERYLNLSFGNTLLTKLFEPNSKDIQQLIIDETRRDLEVWFPKVQILALEVYPVNENYIQLYLKYAIRETNTVEEFTINLGQ